MITSNSVTSVYAWLVGESSLIALAQNNLLSNLERTRKVRTHTFLANNAQNEHGISRNYGAERYYSWEDTTIDCRNYPNLVESPILEDLIDTIAKSRKFKAFEDMITERSGGLISCTPFYSYQKGEENKRYNIKCAQKFEDFDIMRVGVKLSASSKENFERGLEAMKDWNSPFKPKFKHAHA